MNTSHIVIASHTPYESMAPTQNPLFSTTNAINSTTIAPSDNSQEVLEHFRFFINGIMTNIVVLLGLIGNFLTTIILSQKVMRSSTNIYLLALAAWDSVVLINTACLIGLPEISQYFMNHLFPYVVAYVYPLALIAQTATIWLTVSFTVERYIAVCHPLKAATMCTISRAKMVIFGVSFGAILYNIPRWFENTLRIVNNRAEIVSTEFQENANYRKIYYVGLYLLVMCITPVLLLCILNSFLILAVRRSRQQQMNMNVRQSRENNITIMLVSVVIVFIICQVPALVYNLIYAVSETHSFSMQVLSHIRNFLVTFNSSINFILYCALGQKFRRIFLHTFCKQWVKENYMPMSGVHNPSMMPCQRRFTNLHQGPAVSVSDATSNHVVTAGTSGGTTTTTPSQETGTLISQNSLSPGRSNGEREVHTYSALRDKKHLPRTLCTHGDSDEEVTYDMCPLPEADKDIFPLYRTDLRQGNSVKST